MADKAVMLSDNVKRFYEACRITSRYSDLKAILKDIDVELDAADVSDSAVTNCIRDDLGQLIPYDGADNTIKHIIRWCLNHGYLQQAATMTAEWFPYYIVNSGILKINDIRVREDADNARQPWDTWTGYLFKTYDPFSVTKADINNYDLDNITSKSLRSIIKGYNFNCWDIYRFIEGHNESIDKFLKRLMSVSIANPGRSFSLFVSRLQDTDPLKIICNAKYNYPPNKNLQKYIEKGMLTAKTPAHYILDLLFGIKTNILIELFGLDEVVNKRKAKSDDDVSIKIRSRQKVFRKLLFTKQISTKDNDKILDIIARHIFIVEFYRNRMNHGVIEFNGIEGNKKIAEDIEELLTLAEELE